MYNNPNNKNLYIFSKYLNNKYKLIPLNVRESYVGNVRYLPPVSKEWKNTVYVFNNNKIKNFPVYDININLLIKNYFDLYFNKEILDKNFSKKKTFNKIYVSKAEIKHTNNKALVTVYVYNREKISILKRIKLLKKSFFKRIYFIVSNPKNLWNIKKEMALLRKYKLRLSLNLYKFEEKLLFKLNNLIMKYYNKKVEFNIVNVKSIVFNSEFFTRMLGLKLKNRKANLLRKMKSILNKVTLVESSRLKKISRSKGVNKYFVLNYYKKNDLSSILEKDNFNFYELLSKFYYYNVIDENFLKKHYNNIHKIMFSCIRYKNMRGVRLEVKGRLTKRHRADRSIFKVKWKGGLKNIHSSQGGLSSVNMRGYAKPNVEHSIFTSKRRIGSFAIKGWVGGR